MIIPNINTLTILEYCCSFLHLLLDTGVIVYSSRPNFILQISFLQLLDQDLFAFLWYIQRNSRASGRMHAYYHHSRGGKPASGENCWNISSKGNCEFSFLEFANFFVPMLGFITYQIVTYQNVVFITYQIVTYQIVTYQNVAYQIVTYQIYLTKNPPVE